jgi:hypothetical protein
MKLSREQIIELFGSAPEDQDGKKLVEIEFRSPAQGEIYLSNTDSVWRPCPTEFAQTKEPVAIFEDTHRADGTPMEIHPIPNIDGYEAYYSSFNILIISRKMRFWQENKGWSQLTEITDVNVDKYMGYEHSIVYSKIAQPTTLEDLFENGCCWVHYDHTEESVMVTGTKGELVFLDGEYWSMSGFKEANHRWSFKQATPYADANEFVAGGADE